MFEVKEKPKKVERAFLISVIQRKEDEPEAQSLLDELSELVENLSIVVKGKIIVISNVQIKMIKKYNAYLVNLWVLCIFNLS